MDTSTQDQSSPTPSLSAVVVAASNFAAIARTVRHLRAQTIREQIELILVCPTKDALEIEPDELEGFGWVKWVELGPIHDVDQAAGPGMLTAQAPIVVAVEDHAFPAPDWGARVVRAHEQSCGAVGTAMENANPGGSFSWANLLLNYGRWGPSEGGLRVIDQLPGHNIAYKRSLLTPFKDSAQYWMGRSSSLHQDLQAAGHDLLFEPDAKLDHVNPSKPSITLLMRFRSGRLYGATRRRQEKWGVLRRLIYVLGAPLIPFMQYPPIARNAKLCGREDKLRACMPAMALCLLAAGIGEAWGYIFGEGDVAEQLAGMEFERFRQLRSGDFVDLPDLPRA